MATSIQLFFRSRRSERDVTRAFTKITGIAVEPLDVPAPDAAGFALFTTYSEGFDQGVLMSWPGTISLAVSEPHLVEHLARILKTTVLLESVARQDTWLLANEDGACVETRIGYMSDGIELIN